MRPDSPSWTAKSAIGRRGEMCLIEFLEGLGFTVAMSKPGEPKFDLMAVGTIESKVDDLAAVTGCVAVEVARSGKPSGLRTSRAAIWTFGVESRVLWVPTARLRELVDSEPWERKQVGDGLRTTVVLVPTKVLTQHATVFDLNRRNRHGKQKNAS